MPDKPVRKAVRTYLIRNNKIVAIKYKQNNCGYYDIPGGKIEDDETSEEASIREFKEETGITITKQFYVGHNVIEYPNKIFDLDIYVVVDYQGTPINFVENDAMWINLIDLKKNEKNFLALRL